MKVAHVLSEWNRRWSRPQWSGPLAVVVFIGASLFFAAHMQRKGLLDQPPEIGGDATDYDLIAWSLSTGKGFGREAPSAEFQAPYIQAGLKPPVSSPIGPATDRPPLYPLLLAATFRGGRQFHVIRIVQALCLGLVAAAVAKRVFDRAGVVPALLSSCLLLIVDPRPRTMAGEILTECVACLLVTALFLCLASWDQRRRWRDVVLAGVVCGLLVLCRSMLVLWLPILGLGLWSITERAQRWSAGKQIVLFSGLAVAICLPWWVRNVQVLGEFRPLGTQGTEQLSAAYSDEAFARKGMWFNLDEAGFFASIPESAAVPRTLARSRQSEQAAKQWIGQHPVKAALLWPLRVFQEFRPHGPGDLFVLALAAFGLAILWQTPEGRIARWLIAGQMVAVAATWSVAGRFVFPLLGVLHLLAAIGLWGAYVALVERRETSRGWVLSGSDKRPDAGELTAPPILKEPA